MKKKNIYYSEFGAVGDGVAEDFSALKKCHEYANENSCKVCADAGAVYYIGETNGEEIPIMTDVDFGDATFIIDDAAVSVDSKSRIAFIFRIVSQNSIKRYREDSDIVKAINSRGCIEADKTTNIGYSPGYDAMLVVYNDRHSAYIRHGCHATGKPNPQRELVVVDKDGNIDPKTKFLLDYSYVSAIDERRIDDEPITVCGGTFITKANCAPSKYTYYSRGFGIQRSNVTLRNMVHKVEDESTATGTSAPYSGFINTYFVNNVRVEGAILQGHKVYQEEREDDLILPMGTYDIGGSMTTNLTFYDCHQSNFYKDPEKKTTFSEGEYWGIMGTNYCKNLIYDNCTLSRLDAHAGAYNVTIKDTAISYIFFVGGGTALIENSTVINADSSNASFLKLRSDYGSTWKGDIIIKNCTYENYGTDHTVLVDGGWNNWDFGYKTYLPNMIIDNLKVAVPGEIFIFSGFVKGNEPLAIDEENVKGERNLNPMVINANITVKNNKQRNSYIATCNDYIKEKIKIKCE